LIQKIRKFSLASFRWHQKNTPGNVDILRRVGLCLGRPIGHALHGGRISMFQSRPTTPSDSYFGGKQPSLTDRFMWVWSNQRLRVQRGKDHGKDLDWENEDVDGYYRGWYDGEADEMFVVCPNRGQQSGSGQQMRRIPRLLDRVLRRRFGDSFAYRVF
jgi:hypothetical protein